MRDLLPVEAEGQGRLVSSVLNTFDLFGYQRVSLPAFEYAEVLERGLGEIEPSSILRFVEPDSGEVVALRPDVTPQVARLVATRLSERPGPARLSYRGSVLRRQHERARHDQQILQAGIELVGTEPGPRGRLTADVEVIEAVTAALRQAGLSEFVLDLGHGGIAQSLLSEVSPAHRGPLLECLSQKDGAELERRAEGFGLPSATTTALLSLLTLQGGLDVFERAREVLAGTEAMPLIEELCALAQAITDRELAPALVVDLGETRTVAYYTGAMFAILAEGPGQAVASGGRYDALYEKFGASRAAAGAAIHIDHLRWALGSGAGTPPGRVLVVEPADGAGAEGTRALRLLREAGIRAAVYAEAGSARALDYASAWRYSHIARPSPDGTAVQLCAVQLSAVQLSAVLPSVVQPGAVPSSATDEAQEKSLGEMSVEQAVELLRV